MSYNAGILPRSLSRQTLDSAARAQHRLASIAKPATSPVRINLSRAMMAARGDATEIAHICALLDSGARPRGA